MTDPMFEALILHLQLAGEDPDTVMGMQDFCQRGGTLARWVESHADMIRIALSTPGLPRRIARHLQRLGCGRAWWKGGMRHRWFGPAIIYPNGRKEWWRNDVFIRSETGKEGQ